VVFGVVGGTPHEPQVTYLARLLPATPDLLGLADPVEPEEVFRFAAPCAEHACQHFQDATCTLAARISRQVDASVEVLPHCRIRRVCRWWRQEGKAACHRCPMIVTSAYAATPALREAAAPRPLP